MTSEKTMKKNLEIAATGPSTRDELVAQGARLVKVIGMVETWAMPSHLIFTKKGRFWFEESKDGPPHLRVRFNPM